MRRLTWPPPARGTPPPPARARAPAPAVAALACVEGAAAAPEVGARAEAAARAGDDDRPDVVVGVGRVEGGDELAAHGGGERVEPVGAVQRDGQDAVGDLVSDL